ncbi:MAG: ATP-binding protein [Desulfobacteraceae bacterium]|uniref:ATP-binding protein n=1 Tax=Candidatus Desulfaltia bathyphila TaxID=2841697 RepID=A0A8J6TC05_9BACT|nr:ATP-binding protein [Candidatus Desulfaltia bathyphila]
MYKRKLYLKKIMPFINKPVIKVITGMRRVGKSCLLKLIIEGLRKQKQISSDNILYINKELIDYDFIKDYKDLHKYVADSFKRLKGEKYLFVDEIQEIHNWEKAISSFFSNGDIDIFITGSNAHLLSSEIATLISGRFVEFSVYSLSFEEFLLFRDKKKEDATTEFAIYLKFGGFPAIHHFDFDEEVVYQYINSLYNTILLKDVIKRNNVRNVNLLENITRYVFDNIGNIFSAKKISDYMKSQKIKVGIETVQNYISYLLSTFALHKVYRYDIKGKRILELYEKYYTGDIGMRHALLGYKADDISGVLENLVYLELKRRGYKIFIGKFGNQEIDFIAEKENKKIYLQVAYMLSSPDTIEREFSALRNIKDNYPKYVISMDTIFGNDFEGIQRINLIDFLLNPKI